MAQLTLCVHVRRARVSTKTLADGTPVHVSAQAMSLTRSTRALPAPTPFWNEDMKFDVDCVKGSLKIELLSDSVQFNPQLVGLLFIPLYSLRHSNKPREGTWEDMFLPTPSGSLTQTNHQIQLDSHFELPKDLPVETMALLEDKLSKLEIVKKRELLTLETQQKLMREGRLAPPPRSPSHTLCSTNSSSRHGTVATNSSSPHGTVATDRSSPQGTVATNSSSPHGTVATNSSSPHGTVATNSSSPHGTVATNSSSPHGTVATDRSSPHGTVATNSSSPHGTVATNSSSPHGTVATNSSSPHGIAATDRSSPHGIAATDSRKSPSPAALANSQQSSPTKVPLKRDSLKHQPSIEARTVPVERKNAVKERWQSVLRHPGFRAMLTHHTRGARLKSTNRDGTALSQLVNHLQGLKQMNRDIDLRIEEGFSQKSNVYNTRRKTRRASRQKAHKLIDEDFRIHVYKRAIQALIYPASDPDTHQFADTTFKKPTYCSECEGLLWGLNKQGVKCQKCGKACHKRCQSLASQDCFTILESNSSFADSHLVAVNDKMQRMIMTFPARFELLREAFQVPEAEHSRIVDEVAKKILDLAKNFAAQVRVKVTAAQGLALQNVTNKSVYVQVEVGRVKKRTKPYKGTGVLQWNDEFEFECFNYYEPIKVRVWNEQHNTMSKLHQRLTKEGDLFLGQKLIEVQRIGAPQDIWYKLDKRTADNVVSGAINLNVSCQVAGEFTVAPFHTMYTMLHEQLFLYLHMNQNQPLVNVKKMSDDEVGPPPLLPDEALNITDEFALRFSVEPLYRTMVHFKLLVDHHTAPNALVITCSVLNLIKQFMFKHSYEDHSIRGVGLYKLMQELFESSNFGRDNFARLLDKLLAQLRLDLQQYREVFPENEKDRLEDLHNTIMLIKDVIEFQQQAMGMSPGKLSDILSDSMKECFKSTFDVIVQDSIPENYSEHPGLNPDLPPYEFYYNVLRKMIAVEYEDRNTYYPAIKSFCSFNLGDFGLVELWNNFKPTLCTLFDGGSNLEVFPPVEAINLLCAVKKFYEGKVRAVMPPGTDPGYPRWFVPAVKYWIQDFSHVSTRFVTNAWEKDKETQFQSHQGECFSSSSFDTFDLFHAGLKMIHGLDGGILEIKHEYLHEFALVVKSILVHYIDLVATAIPNYVTNLAMVCMLLNNLHFVRYGLQRLYEEMGKEQAGIKCTSELSDLQSVLTKQLGTWCPFVVKSFSDDIRSKVFLIQKQLLQMKAQGAATRNEAKEVASLLLDALCMRAKTMGEKCEKAVLQKLIKELWHVVSEAFQSMLLPSLRGDELSCNYNQRQCAILDHIVDLLKEFFGVEDGGVKKAALEKSCMQLKMSIKLYRQTTETLIAEFMKDASGPDSNQTGSEASYGEVQLEVRASRHPATGEFDGTIRVISASKLTPFQEAQSLKPYVELSVIIPGSHSLNKFKYSTQPKQSLNPAYNQSFKFVLPPSDLCELQVTVRNKTVFGTDRIIGVSVIPLGRALRSSIYTLDLGDSLSLTKMGRALLTVLSQRQNDETAKEFFALKTQQRDGDE